MAPKKSNSKKRRPQVLFGYCTPEEYAAFAEEAKRQRMSISQFVVMAVQRHVQNLRLQRTVEAKQ
jgi:hypothetical protein